MPTLQLRRTSLFWFQGAWEFGSSFWRRVVLFLFVCLFVFQLPRWVIILFLSLTSGWGFLVFFFVFLFLFLFFCFLCFVLFSFKMFNFPTIYLGSGWYFFCFCFVFLFRRLVKFFAFFYFCYLLCFQKLHPLDIKWCALILILLHRWWWTLRHRQFWIPEQFSEKSNSNLKLH